MSDQPVSPSSVPERSGFLSGRIISKGDTPASNANIANIITVVRILLAPVFIWLLLLDDGEMGLIRYLAAALFIFAIVTDTVDGHLARGRNLITNVGIILDPIADKVLTGGALVALSILGELWWWVTILILAREFGITIYRFAVLSKVVIPASRGGKLKTVLQAVAISLFLVPLASVLGDWVLWINYSVMTIAVVLTVYTGVDYLWRAWRHTRKSDSGA
ncbi:CDP-diacylglycerol--glycerol-3-phosphate 3-phosphatidyltransferase [Salinibacterium sp. M195]|uniref:CDP-diacylglycerol--glycerol-3-phosphate 3-phosphatidyltransferase n=1 Tax=Salinibacterium sp. M195 TaxID=2583374 RepID=UPI001C6365CF|nr:CDP-diacylglycerol--glycerol-3-phosphate 3-phosphatidyltransferase [Salinibacterium sp. M195]QYH36452.1 CDP-diacylglycerol--glycerol-3-phosphate 3-phosphatidyltransferase [Salinibacterium sp. M195]